MRRISGHSGAGRAESSLEDPGACSMSSAHRFLRLCRKTIKNLSTAICCVHVQDSFAGRHRSYHSSRSSATGLNSVPVRCLLTLNRAGAALSLRTARALISSIPQVAAPQTTAGRVAEAPSSTGSLRSLVDHHLYGEEDYPSH